MANKRSDEPDEAQLLLCDYSSNEKPWDSTIRGESLLLETSHANCGRSCCQDRSSSSAYDVLQTFWPTIQPRWLEPARDRQIRPTSWLDGVRGLACLVVVIHHSSIYVTHLRQGVVLDLAHILEWPLIQLIVTGTTMVDIFFVVSGYCLSYKALKAARSGDHNKLFNDLSSSTFRRAIRLFLPFIAASFSSAILSYVGYDVRAPRKESLSEQLWTWINAVVQATSPYRVILNTDAFAFGDIFWTITAEYRGSLHVFLVLLALGRAKDTVRLAGLLFVQIYLSLTGRWDILLFHSGILACELHLIHQSHGTPDLLSALMKRLLPVALRKRSLQWIILITMFTYTLFVLSRPNDPRDFGPLKPLFELSHWESPQAWLEVEGGEQRSGAGRPLIVLASFLFIVQVDILFPQLKKWIFERQFPLYLGEISYGLYLMHSQALGIAGDLCFALPWRIFQTLFVSAPREGRLGFGPSVDSIRLLVWMFCMAFFFMPVVCWIGDVTTRTIDRGSIKFALWVEGRCFRS